MQWVFQRRVWYATSWRLTQPVQATTRIPAQMVNRMQTQAIRRRIERQYRQILTLIYNIHNGEEVDPAGRRVRLNTLY